MGLSSTGKRLVYCVFALSGFCALVYEVLWTKHLSLIFGNTIFAVSIVTATFMAGLAIGSYLIGRFADRNINLLLLYGLLEVGIALTALLFVPTLNIVENLYVYWSHRLASLPWVATTINFLFSGMLLLPPAIFMGGTFPIMCRFFARNKSGGQIGRLYALNTIGATLGAFAAGYVLIPAYGLSRTSFLAIAGNLTVAGISFLLARKQGKTDAEGIEHKPQVREMVATKHRPILIAIGVIGFFSLAYEILWTRVFLLFLGNTSYAFALMLSAYLSGIAIGGFLYARLVHPQFNEKRLFIILTLLMGLTILATVPFYDQLAHVFQYAHEISGEQWWLLSSLSFVIVFLLMSVPTILSGALLPAAVAIIDPGKKHTGEGVGLVVLHNTFGAVLGSLTAGFLLIPSFGLLNSFRSMALLNLLLAALLAIYYRQKFRSRRTVPALFVTAAILICLPVKWDQQLLNSGIYCYATKYTMMGGLNQVLENERIIEVIEGTDSTVAVHESLDGTQRFFSVNGKTDGGTGVDMSTQILIGQLPLLLHPQPDDTLVIGLGTGITLHSMGDHPTKSITCVEISPEVVAAEPYFSYANGYALTEPKIELLVNDGRNHLLTTPKLYDVIVSEPSNPWQTGNSNLFTDDFYKLAAKHLKKDGIFCQWIGLYDITLENLKIASQTFLNTFDEILVFNAGSDLILIGANHPLAFDYQQMLQRFDDSSIDSLMESINIEAPGDLIASRYLFAEDTLKKFCADATCLNTDDRPILEFSARFNLGENILGQHQERNLAALSEIQGQTFYMPLTNLGDTPVETASNLKSIADSFVRQGKSYIAKGFRNKAAEISRKARTLTATANNVGAAKL